MSSYGILIMWMGDLLLIYLAFHGSVELVQRCDGKGEVMARIYDSSGFLHGRKDGVFRSEYFICFLDDSNGSFKFVNEWFKDKTKWEVALTKAKEKLNGKG